MLLVVFQNWMETLLLMMLCILFSVLGEVTLRVNWKCSFCVLTLVSLEGAYKSDGKNYHWASYLIGYGTCFMMGILNNNVVQVVKNKIRLKQILLLLKTDFLYYKFWSLFSFPQVFQILLISPLTQIHNISVFLTLENK